MPTTILLSIIAVLIGAFLEDNFVLACYNGLVFQELYHMPYVYGQLIHFPISNQNGKL